ncbi:unnamed protein product [Brassica napus]|uniref:(rape) hypothetical protein n=1 Tax=Brassica napus TaxID=3708 RepID=A0A816Z1N6_BRANA|nr:unnamed protein product [Brassica napus]
MGSFSSRTLVEVSHQVAAVLRYRRRDRLSRSSGVLASRRRGHLRSRTWRDPPMVDF